MMFFFITTARPAHDDDCWSAGSRPTSSRPTKGFSTDANTVATAVAVFCCMRLLLCAIFIVPINSAVIKNVWGANNSEVLFASGGGGTHVYISGTNIGTAFAPPLVFLGLASQLECQVQPFTSAKNRMHCIISSENAPAPMPDYRATGSYITLPLRLYKGSQPAACWQEGTDALEGCSVRFDIGGTPRILRVLTQVVESGDTLRLAGQGINGGLKGAPLLAATLFRGAVPVLGACGEKDCQASNMGAETIGCYSRPDAGGDGVSGGAQENVLATAFSDDTRFGCVLDEVAGGLTGGFFNVSVSAITDPLHRGNAYLGTSPRELKFGSSAAAGISAAAGSLLLLVACCSSFVSPAAVPMFVPTARLELRG